MREDAYDRKAFEGLYTANKEPLNQCKDDLQAMLDLINSIPDVDEEIIEKDTDFSTFYLMLMSSIVMKYLLFKMGFEQVMDNIDSIF